MNQRQDVSSVLGGGPEAGCHVWKVRFFPRVDWFNQEGLSRGGSVSEAIKGS